MDEIFNGVCRSIKEIGVITLVPASLGKVRESPIV